MAAKIQGPYRDEGTKTVVANLKREHSVVGDLEGPTGAAKSTLEREHESFEHEGEPTGVAKQTDVHEHVADWPRPKKSSGSKAVAEAEDKSVSKKKSTRSRNR
jgi:hypothetical protein